MIRQRLRGGLMRAIRYLYWATTASDDDPWLMQVVRHAIDVGQAIGRAEGPSSRKTDVAERPN